MEILLAVLLAYLLGSIPWALVIGKVFYHTDIRTQGSGNLGGTNAGRVLGKKAGITVIILDGLKAFLVVLLCHYFCPSATIFAGLACCFGHCFPIFAGFKGGKAVATSFGYLLGLSLFVTGQWFWMFLFPFLCFMGILYLCKMVSVASLAALGIEVITSFLLQNSLPISLSLLALWLFVTYRHKGNLQRVKEGTEKKITWM